MAFFRRFARDIGIDLGTANTLVYVRDRGIIMNEPSVVAVNARTGQIIAVGDAAKKMVGRTPAHITATRPLVHGIISDFEVTEKMLRYFIEKVQGGARAFVFRPRVVIGIPLEITEVERKAVEDAVLAAGAAEVFLIEEPLAAALGARLPVEESIGTLVVDIGGGTTDIAVISLGGVVASRSLRVAGDELNRNIVQYARDHFNLALGERNAEEVKIRIGSAAPPPEPLEMPMRGRDIITGLPKEVIVNDTQIREAMQRSVRAIVDGVRATVEVTPAELVADIYERGMVLTGGGALLRGLDAVIAEATAVHVRVADDPLTCVVRGTGILLESPELLREVLVPSARAGAASA
ncbi:rod shape-determining protein [Candidatus Uhrbacteria bacterium]|nr:rod shape-determining protein [Candidatus Uhrbacteria bacterium]